MADKNPTQEQMDAVKNFRYPNPNPIDALRQELQLAAVLKSGKKLSEPDLNAKMDEVLTGAFQQVERGDKGESDYLLDVRQALQTKVLPQMQNANTQTLGEFKMKIVQNPKNFEKEQRFFIGETDVTELRNAVESRFGAQKAAINKAGAKNIIDALTEQAFKEALIDNGGMKDIDKKLGEKTAEFKKETDQIKKDRAKGQPVEIAPPPTPKPKQGLDSMDVSVLDATSALPLSTPILGGGRSKGPIPS